MNQVELSDDTKEKMEQRFGNFLDSPYRGEWDQILIVKMRAGELGQLLGSRNPVTGQETVPAAWRYEQASST